MNESIIKNKFVRTFVFLGLSFILLGVALAQEGNNFVVERKVTGGANRFGKKNNIEFKVLKDQVGMYTVKYQVDYDLPIPELRVFDNGQSVLINSFDGTLTFFDANGTEFVKTKIFKGIGAKYERNIVAAIDEDRLAITLSQPGMKHVIFQIYSVDARLIEQWEIMQDFTNGLQYHKEKEIVAISVYSRQTGGLVKSVLFFNDQGKLLSKIYANFTIGKFIKGGQYFSGHTNKGYFLYNLNDKKIVFELKAPDGEIIIDMKYYDQTIAVITTPKPVLEDGKWYYQNPSINLFNTEGQILRSWKDTIPSFSTFGFKKEGRKILFVTNEKIIIIN